MQQNRLKIVEEKKHIWNMLEPSFILDLASMGVVQIIWFFCLKLSGPPQVSGCPPQLKKPAHAPESGGRFLEAWFWEPPHPNEGWTPCHREGLVSFREQRSWCPGLSPSHSVVRPSHPHFPWSDKRPGSLVFLMLHSVEIWSFSCLASIALKQTLQTHFRLQE